MKLLHNQSGSIDILLILVVLVAAAALGGYAYYQQQQVKKADTAAGTGVTVASHLKAKTNAPTIATNPSSGYLVIKEWGVEIKMTDAGKATYNFESRPGASDPLLRSSYDTSIALEAKPAFLTDKSCNASVSMFRSKTSPDSNLSAKEVGNYYYWDGGSPYNCESASDNTLNNSLRHDFSRDNLVAL